MEVARVESCDEEEVGGSAILELEAPLDRLGTTIGTWFSVATVFSAMLIRFGFWPSTHSWENPIIYRELAKR